VQRRNPSNAKGEWRVASISERKKETELEGFGVEKKDVGKGIEQREGTNYLIRSREMPLPARAAECKNRTRHWGATDFHSQGKRKRPLFFRVLLVKNITKKEGETTDRELSRGGKRPDALCAPSQEVGSKNKPHGKKKKKKNPEAKSGAKKRGRRSLSGWRRKYITREADIRARKKTALSTEKEKTLFS